MHQINKHLTSDIVLTCSLVETKGAILIDRSFCVIDARPQTRMMMVLAGLLLVLGIITIEYFVINISPGGAPFGWLAYLFDVSSSKVGMSCRASIISSAARRVKYLRQPKLLEQSRFAYLYS